jgi:hypothetical protein
MIYKFIWNDKREKVKRETMNKNYLEGGLKMIDIDKYIEAIQIKWIKKLTSKHFANWKILNRPNICQFVNLSKLIKRFDC